MRGFDGATKFAEAPDVQVSLCNFGGTYKKDLGDAVDRRVQQPVWPGTHRSHYDSLWSGVEELFAQPIIDASTVDASLRATAQTIWHFGYADDCKCTSHTPNGLAMVKYLAEGEARWTVCDMKKLVPLLRTRLGKDQVNGDNIVEFVENMNAEEMMRAKNDGCAFSSVVQAKGDIMYVLAGLLCCEQIASGLLV